MSEFDFLSESQEVEAVELESVKRLVQLLSNTLKSLQLYPANNPLPREFKRKLYIGLAEHLDQHDELKLEVDASRFLYEGNVVYEEGEKEERLVHPLHQDGMRELVFLKGLEPSEIDDFLGVMEQCLQSRDLEEDLVTMLWEKDLNNIKYLVVDDLLDVDVPSAEDVPDDWDFDRLFRSEIAPSDEEARSLDDDRQGMTQRYRLEQTRELLRKLKEFSPEEVENIQQLLEMDERHKSLDEFLDILAEILVGEQDPSEFSQMMETAGRILDGLVNVTDFRSAKNIIWRLKRFEKKMKGASHQTAPLNQTKAEETRRVVDQAGSEEKIRRISQIVNERELSDLTFLKEYLLSLNWNSVTPIIHMLGDLKNFVARRMACEVLAEKAKDHVDLLREGLTDQRWYVVRNVVSIIGAIGAEEGVKFLKQIARHRDLRVRKEIVSALFKIPGPEAGSLLTSFLKDEDKKVRILASRGLAQRREKGAANAFMAVVKDDDFRDRSPDEKKAMLESFGLIAKDEGIPFLVKMVNKRGWLRRDKHNETRVFAVGAIGQIDDPLAEETLRQLSKKRNKAVRQACQSALRRIETRRIREGGKIRSA